MRHTAAGWQHYVLTKLESRSEFPVQVRLSKWPGAEKNRTMHFSGFSAFAVCKQMFQRPCVHGHWNLNFTCRETFFLSSNFPFKNVQWWCRRSWQPTSGFLPGESLGQRAWWATVRGVAKSRTQLKRLSMHARCGRTEFSSTMEENQYTMSEMSKSKYSNKGYFLKCPQTVQKHMAGTSLDAQWLRLCAFKNKDSALLPFRCGWHGFDSCLGT